MEAYKKLLERSKELVVLQTAAGIINWDLETNMPPRGLMQRGEQLGLLQKIVHRTRTDPEVGKLIAQCEKDSDSLDEIQKRNLYLTKREYDAQTKVPEELVGQMAKQRTIALEKWKKAKAANDWKMFEPELVKMVDLARQYSAILGEVREIPNLYDAMLDQFERGMRAVQVSKIFGELRDRLVPLAAKCADASTNVDTSFLDKVVPTDTQRKIATDLATLVGYETVQGGQENAGGRIDEVEHPFTGGYYDDVRITVKYHEDNVSSMIYAILHEAGHALYEQNLNQEWKYQGLGLAASYGIHESQSRFIENNLGRSSEFINFYLPKLNEFTGGLYSGISTEDFTKAMNLVKPSLIRIDADEVTYSLHIIIRYEIERDLFADKISISELPQIWNERYEEYLGVKVPDDTNGVLQDTHWGAGYFGYFPSYAMGNVYDGMWIERLVKDVPNWLDDVGKGNTAPAIDWMKKNVHHFSSLYDPAELVKKITGKDTTAGPYLDYLQNKYSNLFGF